MTLQELANKEDKLSNQVKDLYRRSPSGNIKEALQTIFHEYRKIHQTYAELSLTHGEALKRGLFIQWYALSEPNYLTGIADLDENAENKIVLALADRLKAGNVDGELVWMVNYYAGWDWIFRRLTSFKGFDSTIVNEQNNRLPDKIDRDEMAQRGQMGKYWNSLTKFNEA